MNIPLDENAKNALDSAAKLLKAGDKPEAVLLAVFELGYIEGLLTMANNQRERVDEIMRRFLAQP